jgi:hypothetical protein
MLTSDPVPDRLVPIPAGDFGWRSLVHTYTVHTYTVHTYTVHTYTVHVYTV